MAFVWLGTLDFSSVGLRRPGEDHVVLIFAAGRAITDHKVADEFGYQTVFARADAVGTRYANQMAIIAGSGLRFQHDAQAFHRYAELLRRSRHWTRLEFIAGPIGSGAPLPTRFNRAIRACRV